jgi:uncharacterized phiE125 gp8 family phage protein
MPLDTLANAKVALLVSGSGDDSLLTQLLAAAESFIEEHTGRDFAGGTFTEYHAASGSMIFLKNYPVATVTSLRIDPARQFGASTERDTTTYAIHSNRGVIESVDGPFLPPYRKGSDDWPESVKVVYTVATDSVPAAVKQAFADLVGHWYKQAKTSSDAGFLMLTESITGTTTKGYSWSLTRGLSIPPGVIELLAPFRVPSL